ncbi:MAG: type II toxin-antitoxin system VapC family toxin [Armatimonadota bacterium]|nr:type II toxin-antitoxin system VapC family toxin [Armatimonadota bacterium]MDR7421265.1 type II toxin-antitoxin system VapC family toxin [Armatimonadota bacterium]MDR7455290.1 type II toxin-antitoxin system VapC family toxin [Armatimonadota bacterium]MDR7455812.1 type II toxin-antitoxin system VapC family toxin [Armatimonadota bacterium]MDR7497915.1 type II toxin-antitoxin system VapC family toxin [Armatimonadota bacterium]
MTVLDTHAWVWLVADPKRVSARARRHIDAEMRGGPLLVSSMSVWEVAMLADRKRLELTMEVEDWVRHCEGLPFLSFVPVSNRVALQTVALPGFPSADPVDRIIVATALGLGAAVVTADRRIRSYPRVRTVW